MKVVCDAFVFQPANVGRNGPPGIVASMTSRLPSLSMSWTPTSAGQAGLLPSQVSAGSQVLVEARQTKPFGRKASAGQLTLDPSQFSAMSQPPAAGRHTVLEGSRESGGQLL